MYCLGGTVSKMHIKKKLRLALISLCIGLEANSRSAVTLTTVLSHLGYFEFNSSSDVLLKPYWQFLIGVLKMNYACNPKTIDINEICR